MAEKARSVKKDHGLLSHVEIQQRQEAEGICAAFVLIPWGNWNNRTDAGARYVNGNNSFGTTNNNIGAFLAS